MSKKKRKKKTFTVDFWEFEKNIAKDPSFKNMGKILGLRGPDHAFMYKGQLYRAYQFPNFGSMTISYWLDGV